MTSPLCKSLRIPPRMLIAAAAAAVLGAPVVAHADATRPSVSVLVRGLDSPKYPSFGPGGLYVPEQGTGGHRCIGVVGFAGTATRACAGETGEIIRVDRHGRTHLVLRGLASLVQRDIDEVQGPISVSANRRRLMVLMRGAYSDQTGESVIPGRIGREFGKLLAVTRRRVIRTRRFADLSRFAARHPQPASMLGGTPAETTFDSDVHDVVPYRGGYAVPDAAANDVLWVHRSGRVSLIARLETQPQTAPSGALGPGSPAQTIDAQAVPSSVAVGPDGSLYVGVLRGIPSLPGSAAVYRVAPGKAPVPVVDGLTRVSDIAFDRSGRLVILEANSGGGLAPSGTPGALLRARLDGDRPVQAEDLAVPGLIAPTGLAIGSDGTAYITNRTDDPGMGEVLRIAGLG